MSFKSKRFSYPKRRLNLYCISLDYASESFFQENRSLKIARRWLGELVFGDFGWLAECDRKEQRSDNERKNQDVSNSFHDYFQ